jgi:hypothetical protein
LLDPPPDSLPQTIVILMLILDRVQRLSASRRHLFGQSNHLVDGLSPIESHYKLFDQLMQLLATLSTAGLLQDVHHHRNHDILPIPSQQRQRAIKVEDDRAKSTLEVIRIDDLNGLNRIGVARH